MKKRTNMRLKREPKSMKKHEKQVLKFDEKSMENMTASESGEPRLVLYSSLISHFRRFRKREKSGEKINEQKNWKSVNKSMKKR